MSDIAAVERSCVLDAPGEIGVLYIYLYNGFLFPLAGHYAISETSPLEQTNFPSSSRRILKI